MLELYGQRLFERAVKDRVAGCVDEVRQHNGIFSGEGLTLPLVEEKYNADQHDNQTCAHGQNPTSPSGTRRGNCGGNWRERERQLKLRRRLQPMTRA